MKSKAFSFNGGIIKQDLKQHGWIGLVYLVGLFFSLPLQLLMMDTQGHFIRFDHIKNYFMVSTEIQGIFICLMPVVAGIFIFHYLQVKVAADMKHSLPIQRGTLFLNHLFSGLLMLVIPVWMTAAIVSVVMNFISFSEKFSTNDWLVWTAVVTTLTAFFFVFSVFVGMMTGISVAQGILTYILLILPAGLLSLLGYHLSIYLYGFSGQFFTDEKLIGWTPMIHLFDVRRLPFEYIHVVTYLILAIVFTFAAYILYMLRQVETAGQTITFRPLSIILKYGFTFCAMLLSGAYFTQSEHVGWLIFGYVIGSLLGYLVIEMILQKTWRIFFKFKFMTGYFGFVVVSTILLVVVKTDLVGYETRVPTMTKIEGVYVGSSVYGMRRELNEQKSIFYGDQTYIEKVRDLHTQITVEQPKENEQNPYHTRSYVIAYKLKNGRLFVREYALPIGSVVKTLAPVLESNYYKQKRFHVAELNQSIDRVTITPSGPIQKKAVITAPQEISEVRQILKEEILSLRYEELMDTTNQWATIRFLPTEVEQNDIVGDEVIHYAWEKSYEKLAQWLQQNGYYEQARILPADIESLEVVKLEGSNMIPNYPEELFRNPHQFNMANLTTSKITDKELIGRALEKYSTHGRGHYYVKFNTIEGQALYGLFTDDNVPEGIR